MLRALLICLATIPSASLAVEDEPIGFKDDVAPILVRNCLGCHDDRKAESGLNMATFAGLRRGGEVMAEGIIEPGDPEASYLIELIRPEGSPRMPYKQPPLGPAEVATLERWIAEGATFDGPSETETPLATLVDPFADLPEIAVTVPTSDPITSVAVTADGRRLAAAKGREVLLFDLPGGTLAATLADHPGPVNAVRFTPDGATLVAAGGRAGLFGAVTVWDVASGSRLHDLRGHADAILAADLAPDGRTLATGSYDRLVKLWDIESGSELRTLKEHTDAVLGLAFAPDGETLATAGADRTVKLWDPATGRRRESLSDATAEVGAVAFSTDGRRLLAGGADRSIRAYDLGGGPARLARTAIAHEGAVLRLVAAPGGEIVYSSGEDRAIKAWDLATLEPRAALPEQPDWPLALAVAPDGSYLAAGRYDGSIALLDPGTGATLKTLRDAPSAPPEKVELVRKATLNPPSPRGATRGQTVRLTLTGNGVGSASAVVTDDPGLVATLHPLDTPDPNRIEVDLALAPDVREGVHRIGLQTPLGVPASQPFAVSAAPETSETEPNDDPGHAPALPLPAVLVGTIERPGDVDHARFEATAGDAIVFRTLARPLSSGLNGAIAVLDDAGNVLAESLGSGAGLDPVLTFRAVSSGTYTLRVADADFGGSGNHFYRVSAGRTPVVADVFPMAVEPGGSAEVRVDGVNLGGVDAATVAAPADAAPGALLPVPIALADGSTPPEPRRVVVAEGRQGLEASPNDAPSQAQAIAAPGGVSGRIEAPGDVDFYRFEATAGVPLILEVHGRRLGSPIDAAIEVADAEGHAVPRAVLRIVGGTTVAFRDHDATGRNIRLVDWNDLDVGDYILAGRELLRLFELPRNPDDDAIFWGLGLARSNPGPRVAFLGTTPEHHPFGQPLSKVEVLPAGTVLPPGAPTVTLDYRNDDGGPGIGKDSYLRFEPPADGSYLVRVEDARGLGGEDFAYHLAIRPPRPDFALSVSTDDPNIPRGGSLVVTVGARRIDGFDGPIRVRVDGLPPGVSATETVIEPEVHAADLLLMADESAPATSPPSWSVRGIATIAGAEVERALDPGGPSGGRVTVTPAADLAIAADRDRLELRPGERVRMALRVDRSPAFEGRVPIEVRNLPMGVKVLDIGLNGILVTEEQVERTVVIEAAPWAAPGERAVFAVGKVEATGIESSTPPIPLVVLPRADAPATAAAPER